MNGKFQVFSRQPTAAFGRFDDVPSSQDKTYKVSAHKVSPAGLRNASDQRRTEINEYAASYGECAVQKSWIELDGITLACGVVELMRESNHNFVSVQDFWTAYRECKRIIAEVNADMDARYA